jgi:hypothetical protein
MYWYPGRGDHWQLEVEHNGFASSYCADFQPNHPQVPASQVQVPDLRSTNFKLFGRVQRHYDDSNVQRDCCGDDHCLVVTTSLDLYYFTFLGIDSVTVRHCLRQDVNSDCP